MTQRVKCLLCSLSLSSDPSPHTEVSHSGSTRNPWVQIPAPTLAPSAIPARAGGKQAHAGGLLCPVYLKCQAPCSVTDPVSQIQMKSGGYDTSLSCTEEGEAGGSLGSRPAGHI